MAANTTIDRNGVARRDPSTGKIAYDRKSSLPNDFKHWLISFHAAPGINFHGYLITADQRDTIAAANRMLDEAEKIGPPHYPPRMMVMVTALATGVALVREIFAARSAEVRQLLETAIDFHFTAIAAREGDDDDMRLMELH